MKRTMPIFACSLITVGILVIGTVGVYRGPEIYQWNEKRRILNRVNVGMQRSAVLKELGRPINIAHSEVDFFATNAYHPIPHYKIDKEVLEYITGSWKLYVYIGCDDKVERLFLART